MSVAAVSPFREREARQVAELDAHVMARRAKGEALPKIAGKLGVTLARVRAAVERCGDPVAASTPAAWSQPLNPNPTPEKVSKRSGAGSRSARRGGTTPTSPTRPRPTSTWSPSRAARWPAATMRPESSRAKAPRLNPRFPIEAFEAFTPGMKCSHTTHPYPKGSRDYRPCCDRSGLDGLHPALRRDPRKDPPKEPKAKAKPARAPPGPRGGRRSPRPSRSTGRTPDAPNTRRRRREPWRLRRAGATTADHRRGGGVHPPPAGPLGSLSG
ncbi:hypothetical protein VT85_26350 (plasmid) [Planctomyces sp. SH-PL62]|nr:hypothetical protein VT85_26350 [Planctomyces sp. SH-PL62]